MRATPRGAEAARAADMGVPPTATAMSPPVTPRLVTVWMAKSSAVLWVTALEPGLVDLSLPPHPLATNARISNGANRAGRNALIRGPSILACIGRPERATPVPHIGGWRFSSSEAESGSTARKRPPNRARSGRASLQIGLAPSRPGALAEQAKHLVGEARHQVVERLGMPVPGRGHRHDHHAFARQLERVAERDRGERRLAHAQ